MSIKSFRYFLKGIELRGETADASDNIEGSIFHNSTDARLRTYIQAAVRTIVTDSQIQTLTNKTVDADNNTISNLEVDNLKSGVLNTSTTLASASDTQVPSALAVKTYVDDTASNLAADIQDVQDNLDAHINDTTDAHDSTAITNTPAGTITAITTQAAVNELDGDIQAHINDTTDAHAASAITNTPAGTVSATTAQAAINELDGDIQGHINDTTDAHDASAISVSPITGVTGTDAQAVLEDLKSQIDAAGDVLGPASSVDNTLARFDGTSGKQIQGSSVVVSDAGAMSALTGVESSGAVNITETFINSADDTNSQTGSNVVLTSTAASVTRLTSSSLDSIGGIDNTTAGRRNIYINTTGDSIRVLNEDPTVTAANRIRTNIGGTGVIPNGGTMETIYNSTTQRHHVLSYLAATGFIEATGGSVTTDGNFKIHTFNSADTFEVLQTSAGFNTLEYLLIAGGGGGGSDSGGGGGAGEYVSSTLSASVGTYPVVIGAGASGGTTGNPGTKGSNSTFNGITANGGGAGTRDTTGGTGGSGGGAGGNGGAASGGASSVTAGVGFAGGAAATTAANRAGGGGGGAGGVGADGVGSSGGIGGTGGIGLSSSITGSAVFRAAGGGGGSQNGSSAALGGTGGAGNGGAGTTSTLATAATANTGSGGGGGGSNGGANDGAGANGGSGVFIIRYRFQ